MTHKWPTVYKEMLDVIASVIIGEVQIKIMMEYHFKLIKPTRLVTQNTRIS